MRTLLTLYSSKFDSATHFEKGGIKRTEMSHYFIPYVYSNSYFERVGMNGCSLGTKDIKNGNSIGVILCSKKGAEVMGTTKKHMWVCLKLSKRGWK